MTVDFVIFIGLVLVLKAEYREAGRREMVHVARKSRSESLGLIFYARGRILARFVWEHKSNIRE